MLPAFVQEKLLSCQHWRAKLDGHGSVWKDGLDPSVELAFSLLAMLLNDLLYMDCTCCVTCICAGETVELPAFTEGQSWMAMAVSERMSWTHGPALPDVSNEQFCSFHQDNLGNGTQTESKLVWSASQCITIYESDKGDNCFLGKSLCLCLKLNALKRCCLKWFAQCIQDKSFHLLFLSGVRPQNTSLHSVEFWIALLILQPFLLLYRLLHFPSAYQCNWPRNHKARF